MQKLLGSWTLALLSSAAVAQCITPSGTSYGTGDDFVANGGVGIPMGVTFTVGGVAYTHVHPCSNGYAFLSDGTVTYTTADYTPTEAEFFSNEPRVAPFWTDLVVDAALGSQLLVDTGVSGECTITWAGVRLYGGSTPFSFNCVLRATGEMECNYDAVVTQTGNAIVGVTPGGGVGTPPPSIDLSATAAPTATDMTHELFAGATFDMADGELLMVPLSPGWFPVFAPGPVTCAGAAVYGQGCTLALNAVYELYDANNPIDIAGSGTAITFLPGAQGYTMLDSFPGVFVSPASAPTAPVVVSAADDGWGTAPLPGPFVLPTGAVISSVQVATNGYVQLTDTVNAGGSDYSPSVGEFEAFAEPTICGPWYDWSPNLGGQLVTWESGGVVYITWDAVPAYGVTATDTFQYQIDTNTGIITIVYDAMSYGGTSGWHTPLFGFTVGSPALSQSLDLSAELPTGLLAVAATVPLEVDGNPPVLGANWVITTSSIDPVSPIAVTMFGNARVDPGLPMQAAGFNAPGCSIYINTVLGSAAVPSVAGVATLTLPIPNLPALTGAQLVAQSLCLTLDNPANLKTSNGLEGTIGY